MQCNVFNLLTQIKSNIPSFVLINYNSKIFLQNMNDGMLGYINHFNDLFQLN